MRPFNELKTQGNGGIQVSVAVAAGVNFAQADLETLAIVKLGRVKPSSFAKSLASLNRVLNAPMSPSQKLVQVFTWLVVEGYDVDLSIHLADVGAVLFVLTPGHVVQFETAFSPEMLDWKLSVS